MPETSKSIMDRYKPWFDYAGCILGSCAWLFAVGSVAILNFHSKESWVDPVFWLTNFSLIPALAYWVFLIVLLFKLTRELGSIPVETIGETGWKFSIYARLVVFWYVLGMMSFITALVAHLAWTALGLYQR